MGVAGAIVLAIVLLLAGALWWVSGTESGTRWALARVQGALGPQLQLVEPRGTLLRGLDVMRLRFENDGLRVEAEDVSLRANLVRAVLGRLHVERLHIARLDVELKPGADEAPDSEPPQDIALPISLRVSEARIDELSITDQASGHTERITGVHARYRGGLRAHTLQEFGASTAYGAVAASGSIGTRAPFALSFDLRYVRAGATLPVVRDDLPLSAHIALNGTLNKLDARITASADRMALNARINLAPRSEQWLRTLHLEARDIDLRRLNTDWPQTAFSLDADGKPADGQPLAGTLSLLNAQPGPVDQERVPLAQLRSRYATNFEAATLSDLLIDFGEGGRLSGNAQASADRATLALQAQAVNLRALYSTLRETALAGPLELDLASDRQAVQGTLAQDNFSLSADAVREGDRIDVRTLSARANDGEANGSAQLSLAGAMPFSANLRFSRFDPAQFGDYPAGHINGSVEAKGQLEERQRQVLAQWLINDSQLRDQPLASRGRAQIESERVSQVEANARWGDTTLEANGAFGRRGDTLRWALDAPQLSRLDERLGGSAAGNGTLTGVWAAPRASFDLRAQRLRAPGDVTIRDVEARGTGGLAPDAPLTLDLRANGLRAGDIEAARLTADLDGTLGKHNAALGVGAQDVDLVLQLAGGWSEAKGWIGRIEDLRNRGRYPLALVAPAPLRIAPEAIVLGRLEATLDNGRLLIRNAEWADGRLQTSGEFTQLPAAWLVVAAGLRDQLRTDLLLNANWQLQSNPQLHGRVEVSRAAGDVTLLSGPPIDMELKQLALRARFDNDAMRAELEMNSTIANANVRLGLSPVATPEGTRLTADAPLDLSARVDVASMRPFSVLFATSGRVDGRLQANVRGSGTLKAPELRGTINGDDLALEVPPYGMYLERGRLRAELEGDVLNLREFVLHGGDGRFQMQGRVPLRPADGGTALTWRAERFAAMNRPDMRLVVSGDGTVRVEEGKLALVGQLGADRGYFELGDNALPELSDDVVIVGETQEVAVHDPTEAALPFQVDLRLALGKDFRLFAYGYQGYLGGRVRLYTNTEGVLRADGRINTDRGRFMAYGKRLEVERGIVRFDGPLDNPTLDVEAWQRNQAVEVGVRITGTVESPHVQLVSEPPVSDGEKLSWLVLGRAPGDAQGADLALLQAAAGTLFGRGDSVGFTQRVAQRLGLDDLSFRGSGELSGNVLAVGKRFSDRVYLSFEQGIGLAQSLVKLDYALSRRWSARLETGSVSGLGLFYRIAFD